MFGPSVEAINGLEELIGRSVNRVLTSNGLDAPSADKLSLANCNLSAESILELN